MTIWEVNPVLHRQIRIESQSVIGFLDLKVFHAFNIVLDINWQVWAVVIFETWEEQRQSGGCKVDGVTTWEVGRVGPEVDAMGVQVSVNSRVQSVVREHHLEW